MLRLGLLALALGAFIFVIQTNSGFERSAHNTAEASSAFTIIKIPGAALAQQLGAPQNTLAEFLEAVTATVDGRVCATVNLRGPANRDSEGNKVIVVGAENQPKACREPVGEIRFYEGHGHPLIVRLPIAPGTVQFLGGAPEPPADPGPPGGQQRGFLRVETHVVGQGLVRGSGSLFGPSGAGPSLLIVPVQAVQPLSVSRAIPYIYAIEDNGQVAIALPGGDYLVTYNNVEYRVLNATASVQVMANQQIEFPAVRLSVTNGQDVELGVQAVRQTLVPAGPPITAPRAGDAGLLTPSRP